MKASELIDDVLSDFDLKPTSDTPYGPGYGRSVTIWLTNEDRARYDALQEKSRRRFSKKVRQMFLRLIAAAEEKAS